MNVFRIAILLSVSLLSLQSFGEARSCQSLFIQKEYDVKEFVIKINGKKESTHLLNMAHVNLISNADVIELKTVLLTIADTGLATITPEQKVMINKFRQDTSFLRSVFQTNSTEHTSPKKFANFVRDFGHLKDMVNINESAQAKEAAQDLLLKFAQLDLTNLLKDAKPASKKSVKKYFKALIKDTRRIMKKHVMEVDELHDVRKNLRDILRFMQTQREIKAADTASFSHEQQTKDLTQIDFLKKTNKKLGEICDDYAAQIIRGEIEETTLIEFPDKMRSRVEWFLENYRFEE